METEQRATVVTGGGGAALPVETDLTYAKATDFGRRVQRPS
jgi:hypothetical protein